ncbi:hypothetical protein [Actinoplanes regularis]|uniref:hypothetical protein n=1 Tax=Actinoplanes regularis TaxID=52697 RepID=UPI00249FF126|nr:hypothetical protein [Actinoplanes regularis]GLW34436.1 hypothetical protein Areg01_73730 [Actinoplanes regularis]
MAQAGEPRGGEEAATTPEAAVEPVPDGGGADPGAAGEAGEPDGAADSLETTRVLGPEVVAGLRAAIAERDLAAAGGTVQPKVAPQQNIPQQTVLQQAVPQQAVPQEAVPQQAVPQQAVPEQGVPQQNTPQAVPHRARPQRFVPQRVGPQRTTPQRAVPQQAAPVEAVPAAPAQPDQAPGRTSKDLKSKSRRNWVFTGAAAAVVILMCWACNGLGGSAPSAETSTGGVPAAPSASASAAPAGPRAATRAVRKVSDLHSVCSQTYFPAAPKYRGKAPHPIVISAQERLDLGDRSVRTLNRYAFSGSAAGKSAWAPVPAKGQLVACLDLLGGGAKLKDCPGDSAKAPKVPLMVGRYRLAVYEVATGRKLSETTLNGSGKVCPWVAVTGSDPTLYTPVDDSQLYRALRPKVAQSVSSPVQPKKRS